MKTFLIGFAIGIAGIALIVAAWFFAPEFVLWLFVFDR